MSMSTEQALADQKAGGTDPNSDAAFGERMRYRLQDMIDNPYSFLPSYTTRYQTLIKYAQSLTPHQAYAMTMLLGKDAARLYPDMPLTAELQFPSVNAIDVTSQVGWYYFAGTCLDENDKEYGILCMLFHYALLPPPIAKKFGLTEVENQIVDVQLAVSVEGGPFYQVDPTVTAGTSGNVGVSDKFYLTADNCSAESTGEDLFPIRLQAKGTDLGQPVPTDIAIDLTFSSGRGYLLQGMDGAVPLVAGMGTRYYSIPGIVLEAKKSSLSISSGTTPIKDSIPLKSGTFWFDHQWGSGMAPSGLPRFASTRATANLNPQAPPGWDFFVMNFDGGYAMTLNSVHTADSVKYIHQTGPTPPAMPAVPVIGKYMDPYGTAFNISGLLTVTDWRKTTHSPNPEKYQAASTWVPHGWTFALTEKVVPERLRNFHAKPITDDAQGLFFSQGSLYVEAATRLYDANNEKVGVGYSEEVGWVDNLPSILHLAGMPTTEEMQKLFTAEPPSWLMKFFSFLYMLKPSAQKELKGIGNCASFPPGPRSRDCGN